MPHKSQEDRHRWFLKKMEDPDYAERRRAYYRAYREKRAARIRESEHASYARNASSKCAACKKWRQRNPDKVREYGKRARAKDVLNHNMRTLVWLSLKRKKGRMRWEKLVGYTRAELRSHLEALFEPGMTWDNYGQWHVDHVRPVSSFNITSATCKAFRSCWALSNLQPLWGEDNIRKGSKWPQQPS